LAYGFTEPQQQKPRDEKPAMRDSDYVSAEQIVRAIYASAKSEIEVADKLRHIRRTAQSQNWGYIEEPCQGGKRKLYGPVSTLPNDIRLRLLQEHLHDCGRMIIPDRRDIHEGQARELVQSFLAAPEWKREVAEARADILDAFDRFHRESRMSLGEAKIFFIQWYDKKILPGEINQQVKVDLGDQVFKLIKRLSRPTLDKWRADRRELGLAGLLPKYEGKGRVKALSDEQQRYIEGLIADNPDRRPRSLYKYLKNKFGKGNTPHETTVYRFYHGWCKKYQQALCFLRSPDEWRSNYQSAQGDAAEKAKYFLHMLEFDSTPADIMCIDGRCTIVGGIDIFSRKAMCLVAPTSKSTAIAALMRRIIIEWGKFDVMIADNGKDYASRHIEAACGALQIELPPIPPFSPHLKPHIERFFRTLSCSLFEELKGYIGHSVADRIRIRSRESFANRMMGKEDRESVRIELTSADLQAKIDAWLDRIYHQERHEGIDCAPNAKAGESEQPIQRILDERTLDVLLAPCGKATVQKKGIRFEGGVYVHPDLACDRNGISHIRRPVNIRRDLQNAGRIYVFDSEMNFICTAEDAALGGLTVEDHVLAQKRQRKAILNQVKAFKTVAEGVGDPMGELIESKRQATGRILSLHQQIPFDSETIREAGKAFEDVHEDVHEGMCEAESCTNDAEVQQEAAEASTKIVPIQREEPTFERGYQRYRYLTRQKAIRPLTERELGWMDGYEHTEEYYKIFVMPYEDEQ
jgi:putative transposase